ncbi:MAG: hypothetical protein IPK52_16715 [Chloroflexi bacterium]|nr:hypothetical protein [Chloroflexota bacterium]
MSLKRMSLILLVLALLVPAGVGAQDDPTTESVVALVLAIPEISGGLDRLTDYETLAYNSNNTYGIWQVEFRDLEGNQVAWAQVQPSTGRVYAWETYFAAADASYEVILPVFQEFVANHPDVRALIRGIDQDEIYPWWDGNTQAWMTWIGDAGDAIMVAVQFDGGSEDSTENPVLTDIWFPNLPSYEEWWVASSSQAVAVAFQQVDIAIALRGKTWTTESELIDQSDTNLWTVRFLSDGTLVASATVNVFEGELIAYEIP